MRQTNTFADLLGDKNDVAVGLDEVTKVTGKQKYFPI